MNFADIKQQFTDNFDYEERSQLGEGKFSEPWGNIHHFFFKGMNSPVATKFIAAVKKCDTDVYQIKTTNYKQHIEIHIADKF